MDECRVCCADQALYNIFNDELSIARNQKIYIVLNNFIFEKVNQKIIYKTLISIASVYFL